MTDACEAYKAAETLEVEHRNGKFASMRRCHLANGRLTSGEILMSLEDARRSLSHLSQRN